MARRIIVCAEGFSPAFTAWCEQLDRQHLPGEEIYRGRNCLYLVDAPDVGPVVLKRFGRTLTGLLGDRWRGTKAQRSYTIAEELVRRDVPTPTPLAWLEWRVGPLVVASMYICRAVSEPRQLHYWLRSDGSEWQARLIAAGHAIAKVDAAGVEHRDLSPGNLVWGACGSHPPRWHLVDLNRIRFGVVPSVDQGGARMARLQGARPGRFEALVVGYARARGAQPATVVGGWRAARQAWLRRRRLGSRTRDGRRRLQRGLRS